MNISRFAVTRPVFTSMVVFIVIILGGISLSRLPIDLMPDITYPSMTISTTYENASPLEIEELITRPVEEAMSAVPGVEEVSSMSAEGQSSVRISFAWGTDLDSAANDVRDRLDRIIPVLPEDTERPYLRKFDLAAFPILILGAHSRLNPLEMRRIIEDQVKYRLEKIPGVASLDIWGGLEREIHVNLLPEKIKALGIPMEEIIQRIKEGNVNFPAGPIDRGNFEVTIRTPGEFTTLREIEDTVVAMRGRVPVRLREIAQVEDSWTRVTRIARVNGEPGIRLSISKQSGTNTVEVAQAALAELERIDRDIPQIKIFPIIDTSSYIRNSITNVGRTAVIGGILAVLVLLLFLGNIRSTLVIATAIPISVIAAFGLMYFAGFTLNLMSLGGLALGVGMLLDNSIVVLENIYRFRESGLPAREAAIEGSAEVSSAIIASTLTTLAVFLPLIFVQGMAGVMFKQLSLVVAFALLCSLLASLSVVPMLASRLLEELPDREQQPDTRARRVLVKSRELFSRVESSYQGLLAVCLERRKATVSAVGLTFVGVILLTTFIGSELMPQTDEGEVRVEAEMEVGTRIELMSEKLEQIESIVVKEVPEISSMVTRGGGSHWRASGTHTGEVRISLKPKWQRLRSSQQIADDLRQKLSRIPGVTVRTRAGQGLFILRMGTSGADRVQIDVRGYDFDTGYGLAEKIREAVETVPGITDARISRERGSPEDLVIVDRRKAADLRLTVSRVANHLMTILSGTRAGYFRDGGNQYTIRVQLKDAQKRQLDELLSLTIINADGNPISVKNLVKVEHGSGPVVIERKNQERVINISAELTGRDMGAVIGEIREKIASITIPREFSVTFAGDYEEQQKSFRELVVIFILALILVYMVMASLYESLRDPFVVMFSVPLAAIGVVLMLFLTGTTFNVQSFIGCIMLGGIVVNNAILLVDHTNLLRRRDGMDMGSAVMEAGRRRLRPILMTALTTIFGLLPLALGLGEGGETQAPMARAVIGGLFSSTLITLVFIPVVYSIFENAPSAVRRKFKSLS